MKSPRLIKNRHGSYYFRLIVPLSMRDAIGKTELRRSLNTKNPKVATLRALYLNLLVEQGKARGEDMPDFSDFDFKNIDKYKIDIRNGVFEADGKADHRDMMAALDKIGNLSTLVAAPAKTAPAPVEEAKPLSPLFSEAILPYLAEMELDNDPSTVYEKRGVYNEFMEIMGDHELDAYKKPEIMAYKTKMQNKGIGAIRINNKIGFLSHFFAWAADNECYNHPVNPCYKLRIGKTAKLREKCEHREQFTHDDLKKIFQPAVYREFMCRPDYFWLPLIALHTGARVEELAQLKTTDFKSDYGVEYFRITEGKTGNAKREVPVCERLKEFGLLRYLEDVRVQGFDNDLLFPYLEHAEEEKDMGGTTPPPKYSKDVSRRFGKLLDLPEINLTSSTLVFHSFRHTLITKLHSDSVKCDQILAKNIVGHEDGSGGDAVHAGYIHSQLPEMKTSLDKVDFGIDLAGFRYESGEFVPLLGQLVEKRKRRIAQAERKAERIAGRAAPKNKTKAT